MSTGQSMTVSGGRTEKWQHTKEIHTTRCPPYPGPLHHVPSARGKSLKSEGAASPCSCPALNLKNSPEIMYAVYIAEQEMANNTATMPL